MEGFLVIAAIVGFIWICSKISQANKEYEERKRREAADRWEELYVGVMYTAAYLCDCSISLIRQ